MATLFVVIVLKKKLSKKRSKKMKKLMCLIIVSIMCFCCLFGCNDSDISSMPQTPQTPQPPPVSQEIDVSSISLSKTSITMTVGDKTPISVTVNPSNATNKNIIWNSSNTTIAEYINGEIYALGEGTCIIKATSTNGITAVCNVKVEKALVYADSVTFPNDTYYLNIGQEISQKLQISPQELDSYKGTISFSNNNIVSATYSNDNNAQLKIVGLSEGETIITVTLEGGKQAKAKIVVLDCSKYVKLNLPETPKTVSYACITSSYYYYTYSSVRIDSINISYTYYNKNTILVNVEINGTKTYDQNGSTGTKVIYYDIVLSKENNVFCERVEKSKYNIAVGETFTHSYSFAATLDNNMTVREFTLGINSKII